MNIKWIPYQNKNNKYIDILLKSLGISGNDDFKKGEKNILHIHWYSPKKIFYYLYLKFFYNTKIVWTVHNRYMHDYKYPIFDKIARKALETFSDKIIVHQKSETKNFPKSVYIPHVNYIDVYGQKVERDNELRKSFGIKDDEILLLSLGVQAPYKLNEKIAEAVMKSINGKIKLLIIGKGKTDFVSNEKVIIKNQFVDDKDVPKYLSIADYAVFYYDDSEMTSGSMILSLSYGLPVIIRNIPASEAVNQSNGFVFESFDDLVNILDNLKKGVYDTIESVKDQSSVNITRELKKIYESFS